jgi:hypothetical protein
VPLTQAELANWVGAIGQCFGALATLGAVLVALGLARSDRRARDLAQARLVTVTVHYRDYGPSTPVGPPIVVNSPPSLRHWPWVEITNHSEQPVLRPCIKSLGDPEPPVHLVPITVEYPLTEVLPPGTTHHVTFRHHIDGEPTRVNVDEMAKPVVVADVKITFTNGSGDWRRTGNDKPVRDRWWRRLGDQ